MYGIKKHAIMLNNGSTTIWNIQYDQIWISHIWSILRKVCEWQSLQTMMIIINFAPNSYGCQQIPSKKREGKQKLFNFIRDTVEYLIKYAKQTRLKFANIFALRRNETSWHMARMMIYFSSMVYSFIIISYTDGSQPILHFYSALGIVI